MREIDYDIVHIIIGSLDVCMWLLFVSSLCLSLCPLNWVKGAFRGAGELFKSCVWVLVCVSGSVGSARDRFTPHVQERWRPFPRQAISLFSVFLCLAGWRWSSLISSEPTGLFFHLRSPSTHHQRRTYFHILFLFNSLSDSQPNHFLSLDKVLYLYLSPALCPLQLRYLTSQSVNHPSLLCLLCCRSP